MKIKPMLGKFSLEDIEYIESRENRDLVEHRIPGLEGNYFQDMGSVPNTIVIVGTKHGDKARDDFLKGIREIFKKGKQTTFVADINTATDLTEVVIEDLEVAEVAGSADTFRYFIKLRKYTEPPKPPATGPLDKGILGDAVNMVDKAMNAIDSLDSIPDFKDPTPPLRDALKGVQTATSGLDGIVGNLKSLFGE
jgi:hypothetical protein